jgi:hypothetical protein
MTTPDRTALLEQVARRIFAIRYNFGPSDLEWITICNMKEINGYRQIFQIAEFVLSLAEATRREDVQIVRHAKASGQPDSPWQNGFNVALACVSADIENTPITLPPIGDADKGRVE